MRKKRNCLGGSNIINHSFELDLLQQKVQSEEEVEVPHQSSLPRVLAQEVPDSSLSPPKDLVASIEEATVTYTEIVTPLKSALSLCHSSNYFEGRNVATVAICSSPSPVMPTPVLSISSMSQQESPSKTSLQLKLGVPTPSPQPPSSPPQLLSLQGLKPTELPNQTESPLQQLASSKLMAAPPSPPTTQQNCLASTNLIPSLSPPVEKLSSHSTLLSPPPLPDKRSSLSSTSHSHPPPPPRIPPLKKSPNVPPVPPPPPALVPSFSIKGRQLCRSASPNSQTTFKRTSLKQLHWVKITRATQGCLWAVTQKQDENLK